MEKFFRYGMIGHKVKRRKNLHEKENRFIGAAADGSAGTDRLEGN